MVKAFWSVMAFVWIGWLQMADYFFRFKKQEPETSPDDYRPIYTTNKSICNKCAFTKTKCNSKLIQALNEKYNDCIFSDKQHYYVRYK